MLSEIIIENLAVIQKAQVSFGSGFTVLTGETGAGKSVIIDSIQAILGNRTSKDLVRSGAEKASIWATFQDIPPIVLSKLEEQGYPFEETLILQREINSEGKNRCRINGLPSTAAVLKEIGGELVQIHGQHDNQSLTNESKHLALLDLYAAHDGLIQSYLNLYRKLQSLQKEQDALQWNEAEKSRKIELLRYEISEIEQEDIQIGEEETLLAQRNRMRNAQALMQALYATQEALSGGQEDEMGAASLLGQALEQLESAVSIVPSLENIAEPLRDAYYSVQEIQRELQQNIYGYEEEEDSLDIVEERLDRLYRLKQKYGASVEEVLAYATKAKQQLETIEGSAERLKTLNTQVEDMQNQAQQLAQKLSESRLAAFERFRAEIETALSSLNMAGACVALRHNCVSLGPSGQDSLEFLFSANPGETPRPLAKIASGGELSRVMLAIKNALAQRDNMPTVIYDEIDTGISGQTAGQIGKMMQESATERQVLCVTHTAQIAAYANEHLFISKKVDEGRTYTKIHCLNQEERIDELARIISGESLTSVAKANAAEMLKSSQNNK